VKDGVKEFVEIMDLREIYWLLGIELKRDCKAGKCHDLAKQLNYYLYFFSFLFLGLTT